MQSQSTSSAPFSLKDGISDFESAILSAILGGLFLLIGTIIGAILTALYQKNRYRLEQKQLKNSITGALKGELVAIKASVQDKIEILEHISKDRKIAQRQNLAVIARMNLPDPTVFVSVADQLGLLGEELSAKTATVYAFKTTVDNILKNLRLEAENDCLAPNEVRMRLTDLSNFSIEIQKLIDSYTNSMI